MAGFFYAQHRMNYPMTSHRVKNLNFEKEARRDFRFLSLPFAGAAMLVAGQQNTTGADRIRMGMFTKLLAGLFVAMLCGVYCLACRC